MKLAENQPVGDLTIYAGIFCKTWSVKDAGTLIPQHSHEHPHLTLLVSGSMWVWCDDRLLGAYSAPATLKIPAHTMHKFLTITDNVVIACVHSTFEGEDVAIAREHVLDLEDR